MKKIALGIAVISIFFLGLSIGKTEKAGLLENKEMVQVGIIVEDVEKSAKEWASFLGLEKAPEIRIATGHELNPTQYKGNPTDAKAKLAFFSLENLTIELIEPVGGPSTWQEFLETKGEGIHHIAFSINDTDETLKNFASEGHNLVQHGGWATGEYSYIEAKKGMGVIIELLENYNN